MTTTLPGTELIKLVARLYYIDDLSQSEIARMVAVSQAKVCRLLRLAREQGIVQISVADEYAAQDLELEAALCATLSLRHAVVIRNLPSVRGEGLSKHVGYFGASALSKMIQSNQVIGLTGSRTLTELVHHLGSFCNPTGLRVVQLMGSIGANVNEHDAIELSRKLAGTFHGALYSLNSPIFVANPQVCRDFMEMEQMKTIWKLYREMDVALVGIGHLKSSVLIDRGVLGEQDLARLLELGAIGETCGRFFDANGQECDSDYRDRVISIPLEKLRRVPLVVGATVGAERADAVVAAARSGLIKALIIDEEGARAALEFAAQVS